MKYIPKKTKVRTTIWKHYSWMEILLAAVAFGIVIGLLSSNLKGKWVVSLLVAGVSAVLLFPMGHGDFFYSEVLQNLRFLFSKKKFNSTEVDKLIPYIGFSEDGVINYPDYYGQVLHIGSKAFDLQTDYVQELDVEHFARALSCIDVGKVMDLVKIDRPIVLDEYIAELDLKIAEVKGTNKQAKIRRALLEARKNQLEYMNAQEKEYRSEYYLVVYDSSLKELNRVMEALKGHISVAGLPCSLLKSAHDVAIFLKYCNTRNFDEREAKGLTAEELLEWVRPEEIRFKLSGYSIDGVSAVSYAVSDYPLSVNNAWGADIMDIDNTKVCVHITPVEQSKAIKRVDKVFQELLARQDAHKASEVLEQETHLESMSELLQSLQNAREGLFDVAIVVTGFNYDDSLSDRTFRKNLKSRIQTNGFVVDSIIARQEEAVITANISRHQALGGSFERGINSSSIAAIFPFVHTAIMEKGGVLYGLNDYPIIWNMWKKDGTHRNANAMVFGRPGSGKSYFLKSLLVSSISDGCVCYVIDPENEYGELVRNVDGAMIDVGTAIKGSLNPFHIYQILTESGEPASSDVVFYSHLKTLESFFKVILENCDSDVLELINNIVVEVYAAKGIDEKTDVTQFKAERFPIFDDLYMLLTQKEKTEKSEMTRALYLKAKNYIKKFASGGRYSDLWDKPSSLAVENIMTVFNFQSLFANKNNLVANAQMLLIFRFLEQQVINIREKNRTAKKQQHIVIIADEAHLFIDPKYPIALDFFYQMVKRIRKYNGTFIPATQNVGDWKSNEELSSKTSAVIKNTQYTFVFALNPSDVEDLAQLYKSNPINEAEKQIITSAGMGECFYLGAYNERETMRIVTSEIAEAMFMDREFWRNYMVLRKDDLSLQTTKED